MDTTYPGILDRVKAVIMDTVFIIIMMVVAKQAFQAIGEVSDLARAITFIFIWVIYEPLCVSTIGKTLGHAANGIAVKRESDPSKNLNFFVAIFRFALKTFLGWVSLLTVGLNDKRKAIHDSVVGSIVVYTKS